ncbi:class I SAM-dependent methyltransferase [Streptomyces similanensis]
MTPTLVRQHVSPTGPGPWADPRARARDWSEIQERMLVPLHEAVYERLEVGAGTRLLALGCGSGLALLTAAARGAAVTGAGPSCPERLALARRRLLPRPAGAPARATVRIVDGPLTDLLGEKTPDGVPGPPYDLITAFDPVGCLPGDGEQLSELLSAAVPLAGRGAAVVLAGWGPPERCATSSVLRAVGGPEAARPAARDGLEDVARRAGLRPAGSGRVACPFGYAGLDSAVRGMLSTGLFDAAVEAGDAGQVAKELAEALHAHQRPDGTVWMPNVFRYLIALTP